MKTAVQEVIDYVNIVNDSGTKLSYEGVTEALQKALVKERTQIETALEEGIQYGNQPFQTFDYPASRYYCFTHGNLS